MHYFFTEYANQHHTLIVGKCKKTKNLPSKMEDAIKNISELNIDGTYFN